MKRNLRQPEVRLPMNARTHAPLFSGGSALRHRLVYLAAILSLGRHADLFANPVGLTVVRGNATATANGSLLTINAGNNAFLDWRSFNILPGESTRFVQPSADSVVINRIRESGASQIWGNLTANGTVILANSHGFYFGPNSMIQVGGNFIATTAPITPDLGSAGSWQFTGLPPLTSIINYGLIEAGPGRSLFLIAEKIENHGELQAPRGNIGLQAGQEVLLSDRPDGRGLSATVRLPSGSVDNSGRIIADAGHVALQAQVVNQNGLIQADSIREHNGVIELVASGQLQLGPNSQLHARGDDSASGSAGGEVTLKSGGTFQDSAGSEVVTAGGSHGGNGGDVEVSAPEIRSLASRFDAGAQPGSKAGRFLLDPDDIELANDGTGSAGNGTVPVGSGTGTLRLNVATAFQNMTFSEITLQARNNITLLAGTVWNLSATTGFQEGQLTLQAGNDILLQSDSRLFDPNNWSVRLEAGVNFDDGSIRSGIGSIVLNGGTGVGLTGGVETSRGSIEMTAGKDIRIETTYGYVRTVGGGNIHLHALSGDINTGEKNDGYDFSSLGYGISAAGLGGVATAAGGDVILEAGHDVISVPTTPTGQRPGASGAYGAQEGDVTVIAGHLIKGNFLVRNGVGTLQAGVTVENGEVTQILNPNADIGEETAPVSLSLIRGSWNVWAGHDIWVSEVRNPNGTFNNNRLTIPAGAYPGNVNNAGGITAPPVRSAFLFDYAADAAANFWAGNAITLKGENLPRVTRQNENMPAIYAPRLSLNAGAGGIDILNSVVLFPSAQGSLQITTRDGGSLRGRQQDAKLIGITMSDSALPDWATFERGQAFVSRHLHDTDPVKLDISGNIENFSLVVPKLAQINVDGDTYNFGFLGQNLSSTAVTEINVGGKITYRGNLTSVELAGGIPLSLLDPLLTADRQIAAKLRYDPVSGRLSFIGVMSATELAFLQHPRVLWFDDFGHPLDVNGELIVTPDTPQGTRPLAITSAQSDAFQQLFNASQSASLGDQGMAIVGPGTFRVHAHDIDLGISGGISVLAPTKPIENLTPLGANLEVKTIGGLDMTSTKIANESYHGNVKVEVGGALEVGGQFTTSSDSQSAKGIFTTGGGNIDVLANDDVNVNGSRIAAYNGGNIRVRSEHGDVNAGTGGAGFVSLQALKLDPLTGKLLRIPASIPGSGILATTVADPTIPPGTRPGTAAPGTYVPLGDITVEAPEGDINASAGGIIQIAFNGVSTRANFVDLKAGGDINAGGSGIIGSNIKLDAGGDINGVIIGSGSLDIQSEANVNVAAFGGTGVNINAGGNITGTVVGGGAVNVSGDSISAALIANSVNASGDTSSAAVGVPVSNVTKADTKVEEDASAKMAKSGESELDEEETKKKNAKPVTLARRVGRVTVILPSKN